MSTVNIFTILVAIFLLCSCHGHFSSQGLCGRCAGVVCQGMPTFHGVLVGNEVFGGLVQFKDTLAFWGSDVLVALAAFFGERPAESWGWCRLQACSSVRNVKLLGAGFTTLTCRPSPSRLILRRELLAPKHSEPAFLEIWNESLRTPALPHCSASAHNLPPNR